MLVPGWLSASSIHRLYLPVIDSNSTIYVISFDHRRFFFSSDIPRYQLDLCKRAMEENTIVHLGTGGGKTHIAVLLMYEFGHMIRKPSKDVCIFLAPTLPLVQQVINS